MHSSDQNFKLELPAINLLLRRIDRSYAVAPTFALRSLLLRCLLFELNHEMI